MMKDGIYLKAIRSLLWLGDERQLFVLLQFSIAVSRQPKYTIKPEPGGITHDLEITTIPIEETIREYRAEGTSTKPLELSTSGVG